MLEKMFIYPIKSCAAMQLRDTWEITDHGELYNVSNCSPMILE
jgi:hypothetical protein